MYQLLQQLIPGSHRTDYARPPTAQTANHRPPWPQQFGMETVRLTPGDCLIFSERLLHATVPYSGRNQRRTLFYKYMPRGATRADVPSRRHYDLSLGGLTNAQKYILGWPDEWGTHGLIDHDEDSSASAATEQPQPAAAKL
jgi:ectoine hydroxylase-related dioxygenase (phytanoyl-CoA dioxygenase family)